MCLLNIEDLLTLFLPPVFQVDRHQGGLTLTELAPGVTVDEVKAKTGAPFKIAEDLHQMEE